MELPLSFGHPAQSIHLVGDFNHWNKVNLPMRSLGSSGVENYLSLVPRSVTNTSTESWDRTMF